MPHCPVNVKLRDPAAPAVSDGGPYCPVKPLPRVSAMRQGVIPTKGSAGVAATAVAESSVTPLAPSGPTPSEAEIDSVEGVQ
jgi:hypothetical protein